MSTLYFDVVSGASGDMILSSLVDCGVPVDFLKKELARLNIPGFTFAIEQQKRSGITASHCVMAWDTPRAYRHVHQILDMIKSAGYPERVYRRCEAVLLKLGNAEAKVHGIPLEQVHFHEIGAVDTIVDVAGVCLCLEYLDVTDIRFSTLTDGKGSVTTAHGVMPVPVPAVVAMSEGYDLRILDIQGELLTPTGCALLTALGTQAQVGFCGTINKSGYGCGDKSLDKSPNVLRVFLSDSAAAAPADRVCVIESDMDHVSGEIMADAAARLLASGALDVSWLPAFMKKGRPGYRLSVLCGPDKQQECVDLIMAHTRTLGVRVRLEDRVVMERTQATGTLLGETVEEKECSYKGRSFTKPEYEALARISGKTGVPVIELMEEFLKGKARKA